MQRILVCLDGSPRAAKVLATAADIARRLDARLTLFRAIGLPHPSSELPPEIGLAEQLKAEAAAYLDALAGGVPPGLVDGCTTAIGTPWDAICAKAADLEADLVVIGSHGYSGIDRLIGTTASKVVHHARSNVLVVRPD